MEELQAKTVFDMGGFARALIAPTPMGAGYHLHHGHADDAVLSRM